MNKKEITLDELKKTFAVFFIDTDPDTGFVSQMKTIAYADTEYYAKMFANFLNSTEEVGDDPNRKYHFIEL